MATRRPNIKLRGDFQRLTSVLAYAVTEWLLMFLLFVNALFSYAITKIASFFGLQIPCLLCSRLEHIIGNKAPDFYRELICHAHKFEISSLAYCQVHKKLSDVHGMCEDCLVSFATQKKSNRETYRLLVGKLRLQFECTAEDNHEIRHNKQLHICSKHEMNSHVEELSDDISGQVPAFSSSSMRCCVCCGVPIRSKLKTSTFFNTSLIGSKVGRLEGSSSCSVICEHHDFLNKKRGRSSGSCQVFSVGKHEHDPLAHIGYSELKITSDSESEVPLSDEDDTRSAIAETFGCSKDLISSSAKEADCMMPDLSSAIPLSDLSLNKPENSSKASVPSLMVSNEQLSCMTYGDSTTNCFATVATGGSDKGQEKVVLQDNVIELNENETVSTSAPSRTFGYGLEDLNWQKVSEPFHRPAAMEFFTPRAVLSSDKAAKRFSESAFPSLLENVMSRASDKAMKEFSETARPSQLDVFFTPRAVPSSRRSVEALSGSIFSSTKPELFSPHAVPSSNKGVEFLSGMTLRSMVPEFFTPRATPSSGPSSVKVEGPLSEAGSSFNMSKSSTTASSLETPVEALGEGSASKRVAEMTVTDNPSSEMASDSVFELLGTTRPEGLSRLKLLRPSSLGNQTIDDPSLLMSGSLDLNDAYKLAVGNKVGHPSESLTDVGGKESSKIPEDLKSLMSQISSLRGISDVAMSPKIQLSGGDFKISDASTPMGLQALHKRLSIERYESGVESLDGSIVSEIEGESADDRLKRQVEYDRKFMHALYKELEEERNASAIAANQAMAMITRLQEEKAALHMEALQYLRMMEEQAEYDQEALQKSNELLAEREKEIQDLELELDSFRKSFQAEPELDQKIESAKQSQHFGHSGGEVVDGLRICQHDNVERYEGRDLSCEQALDDKTLLAQNPKSDLVKMVNDANNRKRNIAKQHYLLNLEDEQDYLSRCLKNLEKRLAQTDFKGAEQGEVAQSNDIEAEEDFSVQDNLCIAERGAPSISSYCTNGLTVGDHSPSVNHDHSLQNSTRNYLSDIENEILHLNERLVALEADKDFLEHTLNSLRSGSEGLKLVQEIAHHLREMRRVWSGAEGTCCS